LGKDIPGGKRKAAREAAEGSPRTSLVTGGACDDRRSWPATLIVYVGLVVLALAVYGQAWNFGFTVFDDPTYVSSNPQVPSGLTLAGVSWAFRTFEDSNWIPLTWISLMADTSVYMGWAGGYHITNILLHTANVLLLFHFLNRATGHRWPSAFVAALFAVHPVHAESVAWVTERKDVLSMLFGLLSLNFYVRYAQTGTYAAWWAAFCSLLASLLAKQTFVTLPFIFLLLDFWPLARLNWERWRPLIWEKLPFFALVPAICTVTLTVQKGHAAYESESAALVLRLANALLAYASYLGKAFCPVFLGAFYPFRNNPSLLSVGGALALLVSATFVAASLRRKYPFLLVGWLWFLGTLVPMIGIVKVGRQQMADRYAYLPFIGLYIAFAWAVMSLVSSRWLKFSMAAVALTFYAVLGFIQVSYWQDGLALARHTCAVTQDNWFAHFLLGYELNAAGRPEDAIEELRESVRMAPDQSECYTRLGKLLFDRGRITEAAHAYRCALAIQEGNIDARAGLGWTCVAEKRYADAKKEFARAVEVDPGLANVRFYLAYVCRLMGDYDESLRDCQSTLALDPDMMACQRLMADNLDSLGRAAEAAEIRRSLPAEAEQPAAPSGRDPAWRPRVLSAIH
jgi:protein O-mannosyl-transferase